MLDPAYFKRLQDRLAEVERQIGDPGLAGNPRRYGELGREHARLRRLLDRAAEYEQQRRALEESRALAAAPDTDPDLKALATEDLRGLEETVPRLERQLLMEMLPSDPEEERNTILEIRAGTGGEEAALFAADLFRMYSRYCEGRGWRVGMIDASPSATGGYKEVVCLVEGEGAYGVLRYESGVHRVQRVPATEAAGRIHTSAASVVALPEVAEVDDIFIPPEELRIDIFCSSGPGGQGVNTTYSAVRITHEPTGLVAQSQDERSQHRNKEKAMAVLKARLLDLRRREEEERTGSARRSMIGSGDRSEKIRTYNFPQNRVTDHRINLTLYTLNRVMDGELGSLLDALREHDLAERIRREMAQS